MRALRDRNGSLILPLITAVRTNVTQDVGSDITGRGINQQTGEIIIQRRLDKSDRAYQRLINRLLLQHQTNLAVNPDQADPGQLTTSGDIGDMADLGIIQQGGLLLPDRRNNVYETIVVPAPQFFTAQYDFTVWAQYQSHMNQMLEAIVGSQLPQGNVWKLDTGKGYWFLASVDGNQYNADNNSDDYSQNERLIRYKFVVKVPGYMLASKIPGGPVPIKRYVSSPSISFQISAGSNGVPTDGGVDDPLLGADDPTLPLVAEGRPSRADLRETNGTRLYPRPDVTNPEDPAVKKLRRGTGPAKFKKVTYLDKNGRLGTKLFRIKSVNEFTGETVLASDASLGGLTIVVTED